MVRKYTEDTVKALTRELTESIVKAQFCMLNAASFDNLKHLALAWFTLLYIQYQRSGRPYICYYIAVNSFCKTATAIVPLYQ